MTKATYARLLEELGDNIKEITFNENKERWELKYHHGDMDEFELFSDLYDFVTADAS